MEQGPFNPFARYAATAAGARAFGGVGRFAKLPTWLRRVILVLLLIALIGVGAVVLFWGVLIGAVIVAVAAAVIWVRSLFRRVREPAPDDSIRRNVRVIARGD